MQNRPIGELITAARQKRDAEDFEGALQLAAEANQKDPGSIEPYYIMGQCQRALGKAGEAVRIFEFLAERLPGEADLEAELALSKWASGQREEGYQMAKEALEKDPDSVFCLETMGLLAREFEYWPVAAECYEKLVNKFPGVLKYIGFLAQSLGNSYRYEEAARVFEEFIKIQGENSENLNQMAMFLFRGRHFEEAVPWYEKSFKLDPKNDEPVFHLARCFIQFGDLKKGKEMAKKALSLNPTSPYTLTLLNDLDPKLIHKSNIEKLFEALEKDQFRGPVEKVMAHIFLGKYFHKKKQYHKAFEQFQAANEERFKGYRDEGVVYDKKLMEENFAETKRIFTRRRMKKMAGQGSDSELPILIVSMPRSGTTLLEQIISSHSQVYGAGELSALERRFLELNIAINKEPDKAIEEIVRENASEWAKTYLEEVPNPAGAKRATDKMPVNFLHLGLFQAMFPKARVIYIRRHPLDTCLSMYSNNLSQGYAYTSRLDTLGHYFNLHADLMRHWRENLDMKFLEVDYAGLVEKPEQKCREILDFCGLEWEDGVMEFYKGRKASYTISQVQVSEPINKKGIGRWKPYKKYIGPLIEALDEDIVGPLGIEEK